MQSNELIMSHLQALLDEERTLLLNGDLEALPSILNRKQELIEKLNGTKVPDLTDIHTKLTRNHALLNSAMEGIRKVSDRLEALKQMRQSLETYDSQGHRQSISAPQNGRMEKRA